MCTFTVPFYGPGSATRPAPCSPVKLAYDVGQALAAFVEALPTVEYFPVQLDPMARANSFPFPVSHCSRDSIQDVPFGFVSLAQLPNLIHVYLIANGAFVQGNDVLETILVLQSSRLQLRKVDFECGALRTFNAQKELTCKLESK